jgi:PRTRC genetic system ThiF family protein
MKIEIKKLYEVMVGEPSAIEVLLVGCGGTGSFLALHLARLAWHLKEIHNKRVEMMFVDFDTIESKNIGRQNFCPAEIGRPKAEALATRYGLAFGQRIAYAIERFSEIPKPSLNALQIVLGCVDNNAARRDLHEALKAADGRTWGLDCGNNKHNGQVLFGNRADIVTPVISEMGWCEGLPLPTVQHPELLDVHVPPIPLATTNESCAELAMREAQSLMINQMVASHAAAMLMRLVSGTLNYYATYFNLETGSATSKFITKE